MYYYFKSVCRFMLIGSYNNYYHIFKKVPLHNQIVQIYMIRNNYLTYFIFSLVFLV